MCGYMAVPEDGRTCFIFMMRTQFERRGSAIAERLARRSVSVEVLSYSCTNNKNRLPVSLRSIFSNNHFLFGRRHSFVQAC